MTAIPITADELKESSLAYTQNFAIVESVDNGRVEFSFDLDPSKWPWLCLPPQHPVLIEKYQYFTSITASWATGLFAPETYSALTGFNWQCPGIHEDCGYGSRAVSVNRETTEGISIDIDVFDKDDRHLVHMECVGASFGDRDFASWRAQSKKNACDQAGQFSVDYASPVSLGLGKYGISLISGLETVNNMPTVTALVTSENGFQPHHPYLTGSGDHVNVAHFIDCGLQMAHLVLQPQTGLQCTSGQASFMRFIELDVPFRIRLTQKESGDGNHRLRFQLTQLNRVCTEMQLTLREEA